MKNCIKCNLSKPAKAFTRHSVTGNRRNVCKVCMLAALRVWKKTPSGVASRRAYAKKVYDKDPTAARARANEWNKNNPGSVLNTHLKRMYGITLDHFNEMLTAQDGKCACCKKPETIVDRRTGKTRRLHVDHNHRTGAVRGLLCTRCNMAVGYIFDDPALALTIADYLIAHTPKQNLVAA